MKVLVNQNTIILIRLAIAATALALAALGIAHVLVHAGPSNCGGVV